jgi:hypothetical protein
MVVTEDRDWYSMVREVTNDSTALSLLTFNMNEIQGDDGLPDPEELLERIMSSPDITIRMENGQPYIP